MKLSSLLVLLIVIYCGCQPQTHYPKLSADYLQSIFSEIKKIDSHANVVKFMPVEEKFQFLDNVIKGGFYEVSPLDIPGKPLEIIEHDYFKSSVLIPDTAAIKESALTRYKFMGSKIVEKQYKDSTENKIYKVRYKDDRISGITTIYKKMNDSVKIRFEYEDGELKRKRLFSSAGRMASLDEFVYKENGTPEYRYTTDDEEENEFEKFEFNNELKQLIITRFDKNKNLLWLKYAEYNDEGFIIYEERYNKRNENLIFRKDAYAFNQKGEIISSKSVWPVTRLKLDFHFQYTKRDSLENWIERRTYEDYKFLGITKRRIIYDGK